MRNEIQKLYSISIEELIDRPILHYQYEEEWMNKMTDEEILQYESEVRDILVRENIFNKDISIKDARLAKFNNRTTLYKLVKQFYK
jgi:hypothetical protein